MNSKPATLLLIALFAEACAPRIAAPTSLEVQAATMLVDWDDIPATQCDPPLHGLYLSYKGGADLLDHDDAAVRVCEHRVNAAETAQRLAEAKCGACEADRQWASWGKVGAGFAGLLTVIVTIFAVREIVDGQKR